MCGGGDSIDGGTDLAVGTEPIIRYQNVLFVILHTNNSSEGRGGSGVREIFTHITHDQKQNVLPKCCGCCIICS